MKLGLGTAQFGLNYGISNKDGMTGIDQAREILNIAASRGVEIIDTAYQYGTSEETLGIILPENHTFKIVTKTPSYTPKTKRDLTIDDAGNLESVFMSSLKRLNLRNIYGLMVHYCDDLLCKNGDLLYKKMNELKKGGLFLKIGVSVYSPDQARRITENFDIDLIQIPLNIFDQRFLQNDFLGYLKSKNIEIHARSVFLQGLLLMTDRDLPAYFNPVKKHFCDYQKFIADMGLTPQEAALGFVSSVREVDHIIAGVNNSQQFLELLNIKPLSVNHEFEKFSLENQAFINPSNWQIH